ncbi:uncharacterized protein LOC110462087 isoform X2 [Mizuhopecten yessoensis]|uniref:Malonyl-[acyl-carrier protein] O-methyltransferase n=1 Tax=Mizuhopecten yessoensis TaxID=6573 RepID=A0A210PYX6_MIZYE|nr:uncharacterized protein LOC110462087 isoform X2 [Mizuhopecten yessoensis]OWF41683.1 Malonyl-[acyl-carrier protein] O-methyltransferase [Mizuhopecten yessoensis]
MVATRIVSLDDSDLYYIPETLKPGINGIDFSLFLPMVGMMTNKAMNCFKKDGPEGYGYDEMPPEVIDILDARTADPDTTVKALTVPVMEHTRSLTTILDLGCGAGHISRALSKCFPGPDIYAVDYCEVAITKALSKTQDVKNVKFLKENVTSLPAAWTRKFDWVILYDVLHDLPDHVNAMKEVDRVLKNDGVASIVDPDVHSKHRDNIGNNNVAGVGFALSALICLPCSLSTDGASGHGVGWGSENKEQFLTSSGWRVKDKRNIGDTKIVLPYRHGSRIVYYPDTFLDIIIQINWTDFP